jgi:hypothetical protein
MVRLDRARLGELRAAERRGTLDSVLPELEAHCFELHTKSISESALTLASAVTEARCRQSGPWASETFSARGNMVGLWLVRMKTVGEKRAVSVRRAYQRWLARIEEASGGRLSEMLCQLAFWVIVAEVPTDDEGLRLAHRALEVAVSPLDRARAITEVGHALMFVPERHGEAEIALEQAVSWAPNDATRWQAQHHHAYLAHVQKRMGVAIERYLVLFRAMTEVPGAFDTDLGWSVAVDLIGFMRSARDQRLDEVQRAYDAAKVLQARLRTE